MKLRLYSYWRSSSAWRVRIALAWKKLDYEYAAIHLGEGQQSKPEYLERNPQGMVPLLELEDGRKLGQSMAIIEYLEELAPAPSLFPADRYLRARARQLAEIVNSSIQPFQNLAVQKRIAAEYRGDEKAWARGFVERGLAAFLRVASETAGRFCIGDSPSLADVFLVPQLYGARRLDADLGPLGRLLEIEAACAELPAFAAAHADRQPDAPSSQV